MNETQFNDVLQILWKHQQLNIKPPLKNCRGHRLYESDFGRFCIPLEYFRKWKLTNLFKRGKQ